MVERIIGICSTKMRGYWGVSECLLDLFRTKEEDFAFWWRIDSTK